MGMAYKGKSAKRYHQTLTQNANSNGGDASRVGKICSYYLAEAVFPSFIYPDAGRVAPISACVSSSTKCYHQALTQNANSNGGDASRVGKICSYYLAGAVFPSFIYPDAGRVGKICSYYLVEAVFPSVIYPDAGRVAPISACVSSQRNFGANQNLKLQYNYCST